MRRNFTRLGNLVSMSVALAVCLPSASTAQTKRKPSPAPSALAFTMKDIDGKDVRLSKYAGKVVLLVNVASKCGNTPQYAALQALYEKYRSRGFVVLAFPSNDFGAQEPGSAAEIRAFCSSTYGVTFPLFSKIAVRGEGQAPLYRFLTSRDTNPRFCGEIEWNFAKFLVDRDGAVTARYSARTQPDDPSVVADIERNLRATRSRTRAERPAGNDQ